MTPWSLEWEVRCTIIYELSEEGAMMPLAVYGERYRVYVREIMYMSMHVREIIERLGRGGLSKLVICETVCLRGQLQEMTRSRDQAMRQCAEVRAQLETTMATLHSVKAEREQERTLLKSKRGRAQTKLELL
ncbi:hypothetical protein AMTR_s00096p00084360 [Amborella trichopoda]|uniref:Uncharacterized protein n=1 Tax=Amborella trichopoda TaxID=13333 RepID=W1P384_AMBTC|nr:hypothetical protein AMTR_s00096p00084360 [Amborella trichopoda]